MPAEINAIVFKTTRLKASRIFFENILQIPIIEGSARHFVVYSKNLRVVFVESTNDFEVEMYVKDKLNHLSKELPSNATHPDFKRYQDPNGIGIIIAGNILTTKK